MGTPIRHGAAQTSAWLTGNSPSCLCLSSSRMMLTVTLPAAATGFTLVELLVVLAITGPAGGLVRRACCRGRQIRLRRSDPGSEQAVEAVQTSTAFRPCRGSNRWLPGRPDAPGWNGPYLKGGVPRDPGAMPMLMKGPGKRGDVDIYLRRRLWRRRAASSASVGNWQ